MKKQYLIFIFSIYFIQSVYSQQEPPYNMHGILNDRKIRIHIADNYQLAKDNYYYYLDSPQTIIKIVPEFVPDNKKGIYDIWREEQKGGTSGFFYFTSYPSDLTLRGFWENPDGSVQYLFTLYHVLNMKGNINGKSIKLILEFTGKADKQSLFYEGFYQYIGLAQKFRLSGKTSGSTGLNELIEEDNNGDFIGFFDFGNENQIVNGKINLRWKSADGTKNLPVIIEY